MITKQMLEAPITTETGLHKIKQLMIMSAELGAARVMQVYEPQSDRLTQRQAYLFFRERDTRFHGAFTHGKVWVEEMVRKGMLHPVRKGAGKNSPLYYSKAELLAARAACEIEEKGLLDIKFL